MLPPGGLVTPRSKPILDVATRKAVFLLLLLRMCDMLYSTLLKWNNSINSMPYNTTQKIAALRLLQDGYVKKETANVCR